MSKYGDFEVVRTARLKCKRANDPSADEDGMREYSYLKCPHCNREVIELASGNVDKQKHAVIRDHIVVCPSFEGDRPSKRGSKIPAISTALIPYQCNNPAHTTLTEDVKRLTEKIEHHEKRLNQHERYFYDLAGALKMQRDPPVDPPCLIEEVGVRECERLMLKDSSATKSPETEALVHSQRALIDQQSKEYASQLRQKDDQIAALESERDQKQREIERLKVERSVMEAKFKAQLKTRPSKSLLAQAAEGHKQHHKRARSPGPG